MSLSIITKSQYISSLEISETVSLVTSIVQETGTIPVQLSFPVQALFTEHKHSKVGNYSVCGFILSSSVVAVFLPATSNNQQHHLIKMKPSWKRSATLAVLMSSESGLVDGE